MQYNFDEVIDRHSTEAEKLEGLRCIWGRTDLLPLWIADMDFATPHFVREAIVKRLEHPILGYTAKTACYYNSIIRWVDDRYDMKVTQDQIEFTPGVMPGINFAINCLTEPGDKIMIMPPVYHPFSQVVQGNHRTLVTCPLQVRNGAYHMDFEKLEKIKKGIRVLLLCNPHNPGGIVWEKEELIRLAEICADDNIVVISDEIHADLTLPPYQHTPFAMVSEKAHNNSITFMSPSKAFNMPGISASHAIIFNPVLLKKFKDIMMSSYASAGHVFAFRAVEAAYTHGTEWLDQCLAYITKNIDYVESFLKTNIPEITFIRPKASYLLWLDCHGLGLSHEELEKLFTEKAKLAVNSGTMFCPENGRCMMRLNVGTPRSVLVKAMNQLHAACQELKTR